MTFYFFQAIFGEGNIITLKSCASEKYVCISNGEIEGASEPITQARFIVHVRRNGVVALQSVNSSDDWLGVFDGNLIGTVKKGFVQIELKGVGSCWK